MQERSYQSRLDDNHDSYSILRGKQTLFIDLGAEQFLAAEREGIKIAVEIKSLVGSREMPEFERGHGQYVLYRSLLKRRDPERILYMAVSNAAYDEHFYPAEGRDLISDEALRLIVFNPKLEEIIQWID